MCIGSENPTYLPAGGTAMLPQSVNGNTPAEAGAPADGAQVDGEAEAPAVDSEPGSVADLV